jgi:hypothetical protein
MSLKIAFAWLVESLRDLDNLKDLRVLDQGAVHVTIKQPTFDEEIMIYVLAGELSTGFVKKTLNANTDRDVHTLFILSPDLITDDGRNALVSDALKLVLKAHGGKVYIYRIEGRSIGIVPVEVDRGWHLTYGQPVDLGQLSGDYATFNDKYLLGVRKVAGFSAFEQHGYHQSAGEEAPPPPPRYSSSDPLWASYELLGVTLAATEDEVKQAYRRKARQHHPDLDTSPDATTKMQAINDAYRKIMKRFEVSL